jgi:glycosyltransferase 2 family protein
VSSAAVRPPPRRAARLRTFTRALVGLVALGLAIFLVHRLVVVVGWDEVLGRLGRANAWGVTVAALLLALQMVFWSWRLRVVVARLARAPGFPTTFQALVGTAVLNLLLPFARLVASLLRARYLAMAAEPPLGKRVFFGVVLFEQLAHLVVMSLVTGAGLIAIAGWFGRWGLFAALLTSAAGLVGLAAWLWKRHRAKVGYWLERRLAARADAAQGLGRQAVEGGKSAARVVLQLGADRALQGPCLVLGLAVFLSGVLAQWAVFGALGVEVHPLAVAVTVSLGQAAGVVFGTPGGLGATEAAMIAGFGLFGVGRAEAASAVLLFRGLHYAVVLALGLPSLAALEWRSVKPRRGQSRYP